MVQAAPGTNSPTHTLTAADEDQVDEARVKSESSGIEHENDAASAPAKPSVDESAILTGKKLAVVFTAMLLSILLVALDQSESIAKHRRSEMKIC